MAFLETSLFLNTPEKLKTKEARRRRRAAAYYRVFFNFGVPRIFLSFYVCFLLFPLTRVPPGRNGRGMTGGIKPPSSRRKCCARHNKTLNRATSDRTSARGMEQEAGQGGGGRKRPARSFIATKWDGDNLSRLPFSLFAKLGVCSRFIHRCVFAKKERGKLIAVLSPITPVLESDGAFEQFLTWWNLLTIRC